MMMTKSLFEFHRFNLNVFAKHKSKSKNAWSWLWCKVVRFDTSVVISAWKGLEGHITLETGTKPNKKNVLKERCSPIHVSKLKHWKPDEFKVNVSTGIPNWWSLSLCVWENQRIHSLMNPLRPSLFIRSLQYIGGTPCTNFELVSFTEQDRKSDKPPQSITRATGNPNVIEYYCLYEGTTDQKTACFPGFSFGLENKHIFHVQQVSR